MYKNKKHRKLDEFNPKKLYNYDLNEDLVPTPFLPSS